jgi:hypothetical protein
MFGGLSQFPASTSVTKLHLYLGCGTLAPARIREQATSDKPVAAAISLSGNGSSFGAISHVVAFALRPSAIVNTIPEARPQCRSKT